MSDYMAMKAEMSPPLEGFEPELIWSRTYCRRFAGEPMSRLGIFEG